ncbi:MAG: hypothetical protein ACYDAM_08735 [Leptospirales bacterium]
MPPAMDHHGRLATFDRSLFTDTVPGGEQCLHLCRWFSLPEESVVSAVFCAPPFSHHKRPVTNEPASLTKMAGSTDSLAG